MLKTVLKDSITQCFIFSIKKKHSAYLVVQFLFFFILKERAKQLQQPRSLVLVKTDCKSELVLCIFMPSKNLRSSESSQVNIIGTSQKYTFALDYFTSSSQTFPEHLIVYSVVLPGIAENYTYPVLALQELEQV